MGQQVYHEEINGAGVCEMLVNTDKADPGEGRVRGKGKLYGPKAESLGPPRLWQDWAAGRKGVPGA